MSGKIFGFVAPSGALVAGYGETTAEAVGHLLEIFGEHLEDQVQAAVVAAVAEVGEAIGDGDAAPHPGGGSDDAEPPPGGAAGGAGDGGPVATEKPADEDSGPDTTVEAGDGEDVVEGQEEGHRCDLCGAAVPDGFAEIALEDYGHVQCMKCSV